MSSTLDQLKKYSIIVADSGDFQKLVQLKPQDSTTNPTLVYRAAQLPAYAHLVEDAVRYGAQQPGDRDARVKAAVDKLFINFGKEILKIIPGRISMELDARLSYDTSKTVERARQLLRLAKESGMDTSRILIKIASTWEGMLAMAQLENEGVHCNMTLMFSLVQAVAASDRRATIISPFVGRVTDFFKAETGRDFAPAEDPGVLLVKSIYNYYKHHRLPTHVMAASFRSVQQVLELAGCDLLTVSPDLLDKLAAMTDPVERKLDPSRAQPVPAMRVDEAVFRHTLDADKMASTKLAEGIRLFATDLEKLEQEIGKRFDAMLPGSDAKTDAATAAAGQVHAQ